MIGPKGLAYDKGIDFISPTQIGHHEFKTRAQNGAQVFVQGEGAESFAAGDEDRVTVHVTEPTITLSGPSHNLLLKPVEGIAPLYAARRLKSLDSHNKVFFANTHTYRLRDVLKDKFTADRVFRHYSIDKHMQKLVAHVAKPKQPKYVFDRGTHYEIVTPSFQVQHELRQGTKWADSKSWIVRSFGQILQRLIELGRGIGHSLRDMNETGKTGGRVMCTSVLFNVLVFLLVASLGLYQLKQNDQNAEKMLQGN